MIASDVIDNIKNFEKYELLLISLAIDYELNKRSKLKI